MKNKNTIARLLAEEDIHVINKKMDTAYFNIKKRELGLPIWKDEISKEEEELMVLQKVQLNVNLLQLRRHPFVKQRQHLNKKKMLLKQHEDEH